MLSVSNALSSNTNIGGGTTTYSYDGNGNMLSATNSANPSHNKSITYNLLNLPLVVTIPTGTATFFYDADGTKWRKTDVLGGVTTNTDYIRGIQYDGPAPDTLDFIQTEEGKAFRHGSTYEYVYYLGDNLGNTRITFGTKNGVSHPNVYQQDDYYPFGLEILRTSPGPNPKNEYLYNKKELQEEFGEYDYGARFYDPVIGRWTNLDLMAALSKRWSTYNYVEDNPIKLTDPDGMEVSYDGANVTYTGEDAVNYGWGLKIASETSKEDRDQDRADAHGYPTAFEPVKSQAGTVAGFVKSLNNTKHKVGTLRGKAAADEMIKLGQVTPSKRGLDPLNTAPFNTMADRYIYTTKGGWLDMAHFMFYAGAAYTFKADGHKDPVGEAVRLGYLQEDVDQVVDSWSANSYEDKPTDRIAAIFGAQVFNPNSSLSIGEQITFYLWDLGATDPTRAPNWDILPEHDSRNAPTFRNKTTIPMFTIK